MLSKKILPVTPPSITSWTWHANLFAILETQEKTKDWIYSNYIRLIASLYDESYAIVDFLPSVVDYIMCPWLKVQAFSREYIDRHYESTKDFFIEAIEENNYIHTVVNEQHMLKELTGVDHERFPHELFIYGYDLDKNTFNIADFTFKNHYAFAETSIDNVCRGYNDISPLDRIIAHRREIVLLLSFEDNTVYRYDRNMVKHSFADYINGSGMDYTKNIVITDNSQINDTDKLGLDAYSIIYKHIGMLIERPEIHDKRIVHAIYDHKVLMVNRIKHLVRNGHMEDNDDIMCRLTDIRNKSRVMRDLYLKYYVNKSSEYIDRLINGYKEIELMERDLYPRIYEKI